MSIKKDTDSFDFKLHGLITLLAVGLLLAVGSLETKPSTTMIFVGFILYVSGNVLIDIQHHKFSVIRLFDYFLLGLLGVVAISSL